MQRRNASLESPQTAGKVERRGGLTKTLLRKVVQEVPPSDSEEMEALLTECVN